jgi:hypothetical protein
MSTFSRQRAYPVSDLPIPFSKAPIYRWEAAGLIKLVRVGGRTMIEDEEIDRILSGKVAVPPHPRRRGYGQIKPKTKPRGRPRKAKPEAPDGTGEAS